MGFFLFFSGKVFSIQSGCVTFVTLYGNLTLYKSLVKSDELFQKKSTGKVDYHGPLQENPGFKIR